MKQILPSSLLILSIAFGHADVAMQPSPIPQETASFGACVSQEYVYVYGGHTGKSHEHSRENLSADFLRHPLERTDEGWERLPEDKGVQGTSLVSWNSLIIRVGGMYATNSRDEDAVMFSTDAVRCYDPSERVWSDWPSLPEEVSSHDAMVMDDVLYVVGGWKLDGPGSGTWHKHGWFLDLENRDEGWSDLPPMPSTRRAGTLAVAEDELWWVGGIGGEEGPSGATFAYHPKKKSWRVGPGLPSTSKTKSFGSSTFSSAGTLFTSGMDGTLYSLDPTASEWAVTAVNHQHGRIFHRSLPVGNGMFWTIAGASQKGHRNDIEVHPIPGQFPMISSNSLWPSFRGGANNEVSTREMPKSWKEDADVVWKVSLPGYGQSTPVFGNGGIYVTSAIEADESEAEKAKANEDSEGTKSKEAADNSMASIIKAADGAMKTGVAVSRIDEETGKLVWITTLPSSDPEPRNKYRSTAAPSPCLDARAVYDWFETGDLIAVDHTGETLWHRNVGGDYGLPKGNHGLGGSLVQDQDSLYVLVDHDGPSYLLALDKANGETRWKVDRLKRVSWSTPVVTEDALIICSNGLVEERDKATGEQRWVVDGLEGNTVASPLVFRDYVLAPSSDRGQTQLLRRGETEERVVWKAEKNSASFASPVFAQGLVILVSKASIASGVDWRTGEERWNFRLPDGCWATPIVHGKDVYFFSKSGATLTTRLTPDGLQELHRSDLTVGSSLIYAVIPAEEKWIIRTGTEITAIAHHKDS